MDLVVVSGEKIAHGNKSQGVKQALQVVFFELLTFFFLTNLLGRVPTYNWGDECRVYWGERSHLLLGISAPYGMMISFMENL